MYKFSSSPNRIVLFNIFLVLLLVSCGNGNSPASVAEKYVRAVVANDRADLQETVNPQELDSAQNASMTMQALGGVFGGSDREILELKTQTTSDDGRRAFVRITGKLKTKVLGAQSIDPIDITISLVKLDNKWYVSPTGQGTPTMPTPNTQQQVSIEDIKKQLVGRWRLVAYENSATKTHYPWDRDWYHELEFQADGNINYYVVDADYPSDRPKYQDKYVMLSTDTISSPLLAGVSNQIQPPPPNDYKISVSGDNMILYAFYGHDDTYFERITP